MEKKRLNLFFQTKDCSNKKYREDFDAYVAIIESDGGTIGYKEGQIEKELRASAKDPENPTEQEIKDANLKEKNGILACMFISGTNKERFGDLKSKLLNDYAKGVDNWPTSVDEAVQLLNTYHVKKQPWGVQMMQMEMAFAQTTNGNNPKENGGRCRSINPNIICHRCGEAEYIA